MIQNVSVVSGFHFQASKQLLLIRIAYFEEEPGLLR
jgi:hypothetical protein